MWLQACNLGTNLSLNLIDLFISIMKVVNFHSVINGSIILGPYTVLPMGDNYYAKYT